jgi:hypothetical protein
MVIEPEFEPRLFNSKVHMLTTMMYYLHDGTFLMVFI